MKILTYPHKILRTKAQNIANPTDPEIQELIQQMIDTMHKANGMGLAANQIGKAIRLCVIEEGGERYIIINPQIKSKSRSQIVMEEGCLSFPGEFLSIKRPEKVKVRYIDENGKKVKLKADGLLARALQHEIDHLDGVLFIDYIKKNGKK